MPPKLWSNYWSYKKVWKSSFHYKNQRAFSNVSNEKVQNEIRDLSEKKSSPLDAIPAKIIKDHEEIFCQKIKIDFDNAIKTGIFPQNLRLADISPVFKKNNKHSKENYLPISVLSGMSKIFERLMLTQMNEYMSNKLSIFLCAYCKGMSSQNCLIFLVEKLKRSLDESKQYGSLNWLI